MSRVGYVNGRFVPHREAAVHVEDRGYQFADGVYEVVAVERGKLIDEVPHLDRLDRSLGELDIRRPMDRAALRLVMRETLRRNRVRDGILYMQVTRGVAPRDHAFPKAASPSLVMTARSRKPKTAAMTSGVSIVTVPDIRWKRCDIKSVSLLPNVMGKQRAAEAGAYEAVQVDADGTVTEGTASNIWIVTAADELVTRNPGEQILNGVTRLAVLEGARQEGLKFVERPFTVDEMLTAREVFLTSTTSHVMPVIRIDDRSVADGRPGPLTRRLIDIYRRHLEQP